MKKSIVSLRRVVLIAVSTGLWCSSAMAQVLPWDGPLNRMKDSLTGPVARAIGVIALAVAGGMLAFGGELSDFTKRILMVVLALAVMLMASTFIANLGMPT